MTSVLDGVRKRTPREVLDARTAGWCACWVSDDAGLAVCARRPNHDAPHAASNGEAWWNGTRVAAERDQLGTVATPAAAAHHEGPRVPTPPTATPPPAPPPGSRWVNEPIPRRPFDPEAARRRAFAVLDELAW